MSMMNNYKGSLSFKAGLIAFGKTLKRFSGTITIIVLARLFTQEDFGTYRQVLFIIGIIITLIEFSIPKSLLYFVPKSQNQQDKEAFISQSYLLLTFLGVLSSIILYINSQYIAEKFNNLLLSDLLKYYSPVIVFLVMSQNFFSSMLISLDKYKYASYSYVFVGMPNIICVLISAYLGLTLQKILILSVFVIAAQYLVLHILTYKLSINLFHLPNLKRIQAQLKYILPLGFTIISGLISVQLDKFVISLYFTAATFAIYSVGAMQIPFIGNLFEGVNAAILPKITEYHINNNKTDIELLCRRAIRKISLIALPIFCFLFFFAHNFIALLYTEKFSAAVPVFRIYLFSIFLKISLCGIIILGTGKTNIILKTSIFTLTLNVILNFIFVKMFGLIGPAIATIGTRFLHQLIFMMWVKFLLDYKITAIFPFYQLMQILFLSILSALIVWPLTMITMPRLFCFGSLGILYVLSYILLLYMFKVLLNSEKEILKETIQKVSSQIMQLSSFRS